MKLFYSIVKSIVGLVIVLIILPAIANAARLAPGNLPQNKPVLPMPEGTFPNYKGNINYSSSDEATSSLGPESLSVEASQAQNQPSSQHAVGKKWPLKGFWQGWQLVVVGLVIIFGGLISYVIYARRKRIGK